MVTYCVQVRVVNDSSYFRKHYDYYDGSEDISCEINKGWITVGVCKNINKDEALKEARELKEIVEYTSDTNLVRIIEYFYNKEKNRFDFVAVSCVSVDKI